MSGESVPFIDQIKKSSKVPEMLLKSFVSIHCIRWMPFQCILKVLKKLTVTWYHWYCNQQKIQKHFSFLNDLGVSPICWLKLECSQVLETLLENLVPDY